MNAFSRIDMVEALRLTRAGKLAEAAALLQGRPASNVSEERSRAPSTLATLQAPGAASETSEKVASFKRGFQSLRNLSPKTRLFSGLGESRRRAVVAVPEGAQFVERVFEGAAGSLSYKVYAPSGYKGQALPVVLMLHGCTQSPNDFAAGTRMNEVAEERTFLVVYPRQPKSANMQKCWNWFQPDHQQRDHGEPALIASVARQVVEEFSADASRIYVAGLSAGGAAAAILGSTHPDVFAAVGVHSGLACGAAKDMPSAFAAMAGNSALRARGGGEAVPSIVFHGDADKTVHVANAEQVLLQAKPETSLTEVVTRGEAAGGMTYTRTAHIDHSGREVLEQWVLHGGGHAWSGGSRDGSFADPRGPDASREMARFFLQHRNGRVERTR